MAVGGPDNFLPCWNLCSWSRIWTPRLFFVFLFVTSVDGFFSSRMPFVGEKAPVVLRKLPGCYMDGKHYSFGERWSPVFIPQGLMVCIRCECLPVEKKGVFQAAGETMCRNIKDLCPEPSCNTPVLRPGKCCKACPGDEEFEDSFTLSPRTRLSNEVFSLDAAQAKQDNNFQALLVGRRVPVASVRTRAVAVVRMTTSKGVVRFCLRYAGLDRPKYLRVVDLRGNVLYQTPVMKSTNGDRKVCGVWGKVSPSYQESIRREKLHAVITTSKYPGGIVGGRIKASKDFSSETFSSLLASATPSGEGAFASIAFNPRSKVASYSINTEGMRGRKSKAGAFTISIMKGSHLIYRTRGTASHKTTKLSGAWRVSKRRQRKQLARSRLRMRVTFTDGQTLMGEIQPKLTCDLFQAVLSSGQTKAKKRLSSAGSAVIRLGDNGRLQYSLQLLGLQREVTKIQIEGHNSRSSSKVRAVGKLHHNYIEEAKKSPDGWVHGTFKRLEAEDIYRLLNNQLHIAVTTARNSVSEIKGRLVAIDYHEHFQEKGLPVTLTPASDQARGGGASVWLALDQGCVLHFDVLLTGKGKRSGPFGLLLGSHGNDHNNGSSGGRSHGGGAKEVAVLRPPVGKRGEIIYQYRHVSGHILDLSEDIFRDLDRGNAYLQINAKRRGQAVYKGNVTIRNSCWRYSNDVDTDVDSDVTSDVVETARHEVDHPFLEDESPSCRFEGLHYSDGTAWIPDVDAACTTCSCVKGETLCQKMTCPKLNCNNPVHLEGKCCPSCPHEDSGQTCQLGRDPRKYPLHSVWHPYLPTQGFTTCAVCTCKPGGKAECEKMPCPVLECPKTEWIPNPNNPCCYQCGGVTTTTKAPLEEPQGDVNMEGTCNFLGEIKANRERWHPNVKPFGYLKCFFCECKDGEFSCGRLTCPKLDCAIKVKHRNVCCEECAADQSKIPPTKERSAFAKIKGQGVCIFAGKEYEDGEKWKPIAATPSDSTDCAVCKCVDGSTKCRLRCPKVCSQDRRGHKCCKHCPARDVRRNTMANMKRRKKTRKSSLKNVDVQGDSHRKKNRKQKQFGQRGRGHKGKRKGSRSKARGKLASTQQFLAMLSTT